MEIFGKLHYLFLLLIALPNIVFSNDIYPELIWKLDLPSSMSTSCAVGDNGKIYVASDDGKVNCLDILTGLKKWEFNTGEVNSHWSSQF